MPSVLRCRSCQRPLSAVLHSNVDPAGTNHADRAPFVPAGNIHLSDGEFFTATEDRYIINLDDGRNLTDHTNVKRLAGCSGMDGCDGPNKLCLCGAEVATEKSDCWMPHALIFEADAVEIVDAASSDISVGG